MSNRAKLVAAFMIPACSITALPGCGEGAASRLEVAQKRVLEQLDEALGGMEVEKTKIERGIRAASEALVGVRKAKAKAEAGAELLAEKAAPYEERVSRCDAVLERIRSSVDSEGSATFAGRALGGKEIGDMTSKVIASRTEAVEQAKAFSKSRDDLRASASGLSSKLAELEKRVSVLRSMMTRVDAEMVAATAMRRASAKIGDGGAGLVDNLADLNARVTALGAEVRSVLEGEAGVVTAGVGSHGLEEAEALIRSSRPVSDPIADIERIVGPARK